MRRVLLAVAAASVLAAPAAAQPRRPAPAPAAPALSLTCDGPIRATTTEADLRRIFGAANVRRETIPMAEGQEVAATVVYPNDPARRLEVTWSDPARRTRIESAGVRAFGEERRGTAWRGPANLRVGSTLADVERANGRPFTVGGFGWDYGGYVLDWRGGRLRQPERPCRVGVRMEPGADASGDGALGEGSFRSDSRGVRAQRPVVSEIALGFAR